MNRKLLILDVVLAAVAVYAGFQFRGQWLAAKAREAAIVNRKPLSACQRSESPSTATGSGRMFSPGSRQPR